jgi:MarR family 2-MHQ and catechol resistance regulon transcriptional repressor
MVRAARRPSRDAAVKEQSTAASHGAAPSRKGASKKREEPARAVHTALDYARQSKFATSGGANSLFVSLLRAGHAIFKKVEEAVEGQGESVLTFRPLAIVVRFGPQTQQDIARLTAQHPAGVSRIVDELEERKLVRRVRGEQDRRTIRVEPTDEGRALFERIDPFATGALEAAIAVLDEKERAAFNAMLDKIVAANGT